VSAGELDEQLAPAAALASELAPVLCTPAGEGGAGCAWYHALYPSLRVLGLAATPERHGAFYDEVIGSLARGGAHRRIAVTGAADAGMLAHVLRAYRREGAHPRIDVIDRCATPLRLCADYAARTAADVRTVVSDVLGWTPTERFDLITTHAFIGMFPHAQQPRLAARWRRALRSGGTLVSVARVDPAWTAACPGFSAPQAAAFRDLVAGRVRERGAPADGDERSWAARASAYARRMRSFPFASVEALVTLLADAGLAVDRLDLAHFEGHARADQSGPGTHRPGTFAHFVATAIG
jgi:SAM-dependent methyltransferase